MSAAHRLLCLALLGAAACSKTAAPPPTPPAVTCTDAAPCALEPSGAAKDGLIAAAGQVDVYSLEVAAARASVRTILNVRVEDAAPVTPVKLVFLLVAPDGKSVLASRGPARTTGPQSLLGSFLLPGAGSYRVIVRDVLSAASDSHNGYTVQAALIDDPDAAFEPDDALPAARPIGFSAATATASGSVAFAGDRDLLTFAVAVPGSIARTWTRCSISRFPASTS